MTTNCDHGLNKPDQDPGPQGRVKTQAVSCSGILCGFMFLPDGIRWQKVCAGRVTTVIATAVTTQGIEGPSRATRGRGRGAAARGPARGPALRGRPSRTGGMSVATAVVTATEGEEAATIDTAAVMSPAAGAASTVTRNRYEFDLPWTDEEEQRLLEGYMLNTKAAEQAIDPAKSSTYESFLTCGHGINACRDLYHRHCLEVAYECSDVLLAV